MFLKSTDPWTLGYISYVSPFEPTSIILKMDFNAEDIPDTFTSSSRGDGGIGGGPTLMTHTATVLHARPSCIIHIANEDPEMNLVCPRDESFWQTILQAAQINRLLPKCNDRYKQPKRHFSLEN